MPLPFAVAKEEFEKSVPEAQRGLYVEDKDVGYRLDVSGIEDPAELRRGKQRETEARKAAEKQLADFQAAQKKAEEDNRKALEEAARKAGDTASLDKSWKERHDREMAELRQQLDGTISSQEGDIKRLLVDHVAMGIAARVALPDSAEVVAEQIKKRLRVEVRDGQRVTVVIDAEGKPSALSIAELEKEIVASKALAPLLVGSKASGGGANGGKGGSAASDSNVMTRADFDRMTPAEKTAFSKKGGRLVNDASQAA